MKKLIALLLSLVMLMSLVACSATESGSMNGDSAKPNDNITNKLDEKHAPFVGRWERGAYWNSDDGSFDEFHEIMIQDTGYYYIEFYSNGTGVCNQWYDDYYNDATVFEWAVEYDDFFKQDVLRMYFAWVADEPDEEGDENGFYVHRSTCLVTEPKKAYILGVMGSSAWDPSENYDEPIETLSMPFFENHEPYAKIVNEEFEDCPELECEEALACIRTYRQQKDTE